MDCKSRSRLRRWTIVAIILIATVASRMEAQWVTQDFVLSEGWNAVSLAVDPWPSDCDLVFGCESRILSVRRWCPRSFDDLQYDEAAGTALPSGGSWLTWFPSNHVNRTLLDMGQAVGGAAYLIQVSAGVPMVFTVGGHPMALTYTWDAGVDHFVGLPAMPTPPVSFTTFFAAATNEIPVDFHRGGEVYRVRSDGSHERIYQPSLATLLAGRAYWIRAAERSEYAGPIAVKVEGPRGWIDFGNRLVPQYLNIVNVSAVPRGVRIVHAASGSPPAGAQAVAGPVPLRFAVARPLELVVGRTYQTFPATWTTQLQAGASVRLALLPSASQIALGAANTSFQSVLEISDDASGLQTVMQRVGVRVEARSGSVADARGLWVGAASVTDVSRVKMLAVTITNEAPIAVARPFGLRLLVHVDAQGTARLLQRALVGTRTDAVTGAIMTDLLSDESQAAAYRVAHPGAKLFRVSSAAFPFMDPLPLSGGTFGVPNQALRGDVEMGRDDPVNPFRHTYSPMHDNQERRAETNVPYDEDVEVFSVRREVQLLFQPPDESNPDPRWGASVCGGIYREDIYGLGGPLDASNRVVQVKGVFRLERAVPAAALQ